MREMESRAFDAVVEEELRALGELLTAGGKSVLLLVVTSTDCQVETYLHRKVKGGDRPDIAQGLVTIADHVATELRG